MIRWGLAGSAIVCWLFCLFIYFVVLVDGIDLFVSSFNLVSMRAICYTWVEEMGFQLLKEL